MVCVLFETLWHSQSDGWSIASRAYARAMHEAGIEVQLHSWIGALEEPEPEVLKEVGHLLEKRRPRDLYVFSCTLSGEWGTPHTLRPLGKARRPRAFFTMFERRQVDANTVAGMNELEAVWVPCSFNADILRAAGTRNVTYIPFPYFDDDPHLSLPPPRRQPNSFYWIGRWEPRKAPDNLVRAFIRAFKLGEATLTLKIGAVPWRDETYPSPEEVMRREGGDPSMFDIIRGRLPPEDLVAIHAQGDIYCSASRGEGLDLPAFAAKLAGRRVVTTDSGGPRDFLTETDILVPATGEVPTDPRYRWDEGSTFADYDLDALVAALQKARGDARPPEKIYPRFRASNVGDTLRGWAEGILARCPTEPAPPPQMIDFGQWVLDGE